VPDETLLTFTGYLVFRGTFVCRLAVRGRAHRQRVRITISYLIGRTFGIKAIHRYGRYVRIREEHVEKAHAWFRKAGPLSLTLGTSFPASGT